MSKCGPNTGSGSHRLSVGKQVLQIALPFDDDARDTASAAEATGGQASGAATPTGEEDDGKRKWYSLYDKVFAKANLWQAWEKVRANTCFPHILRRPSIRGHVCRVDSNGSI